MTTDDGATEDRQPSRRSKVTRVVQQYELSGLDEELVNLWTDEGNEQWSLRELATYLNQELLRAAMEEAGMSPLDGEVENTYRLLTDDDVSSGMQVEAETTLERNGIDVERLMKDFVSHQAVHTYLTQYRNVERPETESTDQVETTIETVQRLQSRLIAVVEKRLQSLQNSGKFTLGSFSVFVDVRVLCEDCGTQSELLTLLRNGGCECQEQD